jgi:hypothetical protein
MKTNETTDRALNPTLENLVAELTAAAYPVALRYRGSNRWLDLELEIWHALTDAAGKWSREAH